MPRLPADPVGRLAKLEAIRAEVRRGTTVNAAELGQVLGITWRFLKQMIDNDPAFPVKARGDMGVPWEFPLLKVVDHLIKQARTAQAGRERRMAETLRLTGLGEAAAVYSPGEGPKAGSGSAAAMTEEARALSSLLDVQAKVRAEKERQNELLDRAPVQAFLWRWMSALQGSVLATKNRLDKTGTLPPELRAALGDELELTLVHMRADLEAEIGRQNAPRR